MRKKKLSSLDRFGIYTLMENTYPTLATFMSWGYARSTYYKVKKEFEEIKNNHEKVMKADVEDTSCVWPFEASKETKDILRNSVLINDYNIYESWYKFENWMEVMPSIEVAW